MLSAAVVASGPIEELTYRVQLGALPRDAVRLEATWTSVGLVVAVATQADSVGGDDRFRVEYLLISDDS